MEHDVFISYSSKDKEIAGVICEDLESAGIKCWIAPRNMPAGVTYSSHLVDAINASRIFLVVLSSHANKSRHVVSEVNIAFNSKLPIVPVRIEDIPLSDSLQYYLSQDHFFDISDSDLEKHRKNLAPTIKAWLDSPPGDGQRKSWPKERPSHPKSKGMLARLKESAKMLMAITLLAPALTVAYWQWAVKPDVKIVAEHIKEAHRLYELRSYPAAIEECDKALAEDPGNQEAASLRQQIQKTLDILNREE